MKGGIKINELKEFLCAKNKHIDSDLKIFIPRERDRNFIRQFRINRENLKYLLRELDESNYSKGPEEDRDFKGEFLFFFGMIIEDTEFYIKLKLKDNVLTVLSFKPADYPIQYKWELKEANDEHYKVSS